MEFRARHPTSPACFCTEGIKFFGEPIPSCRDFHSVKICVPVFPGYGGRMIREIVTYGDPVLREKCPPAGEITAAIRTLASDMVDTMRAANGVGIAHRGLTPM